MLTVSSRVTIPDSEIQCDAIRAQGTGGQNVNKVSTAIHLRFDIKKSSLPDDYKTRLLSYNDQRISKDGVIVIKAQQFRSQGKNRENALKRLKELIQTAMVCRKKRKPTRPSRSAGKKRLEHKTKHGRLKKTRGRVTINGSS